MTAQHAVVLLQMALSGEHGEQVIVNMLYVHVLFHTCTYNIFTITSSARAIADKQKEGGCVR